MEKEQRNSLIRTIGLIVIAIIFSSFASHIMTKGKYKKKINKERKIQDSLKSHIFDLRHLQKKDSVRYMEALNKLKEDSVMLSEKVDSLTKVRNNAKRRISRYFDGDFNERFSKFTELIPGQDSLQRP